MTTHPIRTFEELALALKRFEELFGAAEGSPAASELRNLSARLRGFEDRVAAGLAAQNTRSRCTLDRLSAYCQKPANSP